MKKFPVILTGLTIFAGVFLANIPSSHADLMVVPTRLMFTDRDRVQDLSVINSADESATFKMSLQNLKQNEIGGFTEQTEPLDPFFDPEKNLVFSPKRMSLPAQQKQRVRVSVRRPENLPDGEYRAHLKIERIANPAPPKQGEPGKITAQVIINLAYAIPIVVRQGISDATATISTIKLFPSEAGKPAMLKVAVDRQGKFGTMGTIKIFWTAPGKSEVQIGILNNFNIYNGTPRMTAQIPLTENNIPNGSIKVVYEGDGLDAEKIFSEKIFPISG